jgi:zinc protease
MKFLLSVFAGMFLGCQVMLAGVGGYAVVVPESLQTNTAWQAVADALVKKYDDTKVYRYKTSPMELQNVLAADHPRYLALVAPPSMIGKGIVCELSRLTRKFDADLYGDALWGIITGYTADDAMRIVKTKKPLVIERAFGSTGFDTSLMQDSLIVSDAVEGKVRFKLNNGSESCTTNDVKAPQGVVNVVMDFWQKQSPQAFITSGHATQYNLEMSWGQGLFTCYSNRFYALRHDQVQGFAKLLRGVIFDGKESDVVDCVRSFNAPALPVSSEPKVWVGAGNCLLGDANHSRNTMVITALSAGGFNQLVGYVVTTWFGRMGWGTLGNFTTPQKLTLSQAFFISNQALLQESIEKYPGLIKVSYNPEADGSFFSFIRKKSAQQKFAAAGIRSLDKTGLGLLHDRDVVAFFGDPGWQATMPGKPSVTVVQKWKDGEVKLTIKTSKNFKPGAGFNLIFDKPIDKPVLSGCADWKKVLTNDFMMVSKSDLKPGEVRVISIKRG